jgi:hypothetical protein
LIKVQIKASCGLAKQELLEEMVASRKDPTGIDREKAPHAPRITLAIDPPDGNQSHGQTASTAGAAVSRYQSRHAA